MTSQAKYEMALQRYKTWSQIFSRALTMNREEGIYGRLSDTQGEVLTHYVRGKIVHDLGAGDLKLSKKLVKCGALGVVAVDKEKARTKNKKIQFVHSDFAEMRHIQATTIFLSWPAMEPQLGLQQILNRAQTIVYLGKNTDGLQCGWPELFQGFLKRELLEYVEEDSNSLIILGKKLKVPRKATAEELAAIG